MSCNKLNKENIIMPTGQETQHNSVETVKLLALC